MTFSIEFNEQNTDEFNAMMDELQGELINEQKEISKELGISVGCAANIQYLRTRSRWSQGLENELIRAEKAGEPGPNMNEFGC